MTQRFKRTRLLLGKAKSLVNLLRAKKPDEDLNKHRELVKRFKKLLSREQYDGINKEVRKSPEALGALFEIINKGHVTEGLFLILHDATKDLRDISPVVPRLEETCNGQGSQLKMCAAKALMRHHLNSCDAGKLKELLGNISTDNFVRWGVEDVLENCGGINLSTTLGVLLENFEKGDRTARTLATGFLLNMVEFNEESRTFIYAAIMKLKYRDDVYLDTRENIKKVEALLSETMGDQPIKI